MLSTSLSNNFLPLIYTRNMKEEINVLKISTKDQQYVHTTTIFSNNKPDVHNVAYDVTYIYFGLIH